MNMEHKRNICLDSFCLKILNETMILRSISKNKDKVNLNEFKKMVIDECKDLFKKIDNGDLTEDNILESIRKIANHFSISFGQAQKPINTILKYYFYLICNNNYDLEKNLHCPIDSKILKHLRKEIKKILENLSEEEREDYLNFQENIIKKLSLKELDEECYEKIQEKIKEIQEKRGINSKVEFDLEWDKQNINKLNETDS